MQKLLKYFCRAVYPLIISLIILQVFLPAFAQNSEQFSVTAYYPSPSGIYDQVSVGGSLNFGEGLQIQAGAVLSGPMNKLITFRSTGPDRGIRFHEHVIFRGNVIFSGNVTVNGNLSADNLRSHGDIQAEYIHSSGNIIGNGITASGFIAAAQVRDTSRRLDLGASLVNRHESDYRLFWNIWRTEFAMSLGFDAAAIICAAFDWGAAGAFIGLATLETVRAALTLIDILNTALPLNVSY